MISHIIYKESSPFETEFSPELNEYTSQNHSDFLKISSLNFSPLLESNETINLIQAKTLLNDIRVGLSSGHLITEIPPYLIPRLLDLSSAFPDDFEIVNYSVLFIFHFSELNDEVCSNFLNESILGFLVNILMNSQNGFAVFKAFQSFSNFINQKPQTQSQINADEILENTFQFLESYSERFDEIHHEIIESAFNLISNCSNYPDINLNAILTQLNGMIDRSTLFSSEIGLVYRDFSIRAILYILKLNRIEFSEENFEFLVNQLQNNNEEILNVTFSVIEELARNSPSPFSLSLISCENSLFEFTPSCPLGDKSKELYCSAISATLEKTAKSYELREYIELLNPAIEKLRSKAGDFANLMHDFMTDEPFCVSNPAACALCQFILLNDSMILHTLTQGYLEIIVEDFIRLLYANEIDVVFYLIKGLRVLAAFGNDISANIGIPNPVLSVLFENDIDHALEACLDAYGENQEYKIDDSIQKFREEIENYQNFEEIDAEAEYIPEICL